MTADTDTVRTHLTTGAGESLDAFDVVECNHPAWLDQHPSGFGAVSHIDEGDVFFYNAQRIVDTVAGYDAASFILYVDSILDWWTASVMLLSMGMEVETAILRFSVDFPDSFGWFASHPDVLAGRFSLSDWLAPEWKEI